MSLSRPKIIIMVAIVLLVAALLTRGFGLLGRHHDNRLTLSGNVDIRQVDLGFRVMGRIAAPGMRVLVTSDGNPKTYHGTIGFISPTAEFTPRPRLNSRPRPSRRSLSARIWFTACA
jgi:hypothetical protein